MERHNTVLNLKEVETSLPFTFNYINNFLNLTEKQDELSTLFTQAWNEVSGLINDKGTIFVDNYIFKPGISIYETPNEEASKAIKNLHALKDKILYNAVDEECADKVMKPNFAFSFTKARKPIKLSPESIQLLIKKLPTGKAKKTFTSAEFKAQFPSAYKVMILRNEVRMLEKLQSSIWNDVSNELHSKYDANTTITILSNPELKIALFETPHIELKEIPAKVLIKTKLAQMYQNITNLHNQFITKGQTKKDYTLYFTSYTK